VDNAANTFQAVVAGAPSTGGFGTYAMSAGGVWAYTLDDANVTVNSLNTGQTLNDTFTVHAADGTAQVVTVTINGTNDAAGVLAAVVSLSAAAVAEGGTITHGEPGHGPGPKSVTVTLNNGHTITIAAGQTSGAVTVAVPNVWRRRPVRKWRRSRPYRLGRLRSPRSTRRR
jgi:VCBS repeat-containing protein